MYDSRIYSNLFDPGDLLEFGTLLPQSSSPEYQYNNNNNNDDIPPGDVIGYYLKKRLLQEIKFIKQAAFIHI
jgi:hypothetical protein